MITLIACKASNIWKGIILYLFFGIVGCSSDDGINSSNIKKYVVKNSLTNQPMEGVYVGLSGDKYLCGMYFCYKSFGQGYTDENGEVTIRVNNYDKKIERIYLTYEDCSKGINYSSNIKEILLDCE